MNKFNIDEMVNVSLEGLIHGKLIILSETMTIYGIFKNVEKGNNFTYEYYVKNDSMEDGKWVVENKISKPGTAK